jgi:hypothetical protein
MAVLRRHHPRRAALALERPAAVIRAVLASPAPGLHPQRLERVQGDEAREGKSHPSCGGRGLHGADPGEFGGMR